MPSRLDFMFGLLAVLSTAQALGGEPRGRAQADAALPWAYSLNGYHFALPNASDYFVGIAIAERAALHLEARYNL